MHGLQVMQFTVYKYLYCIILHLRYSSTEIVNGTTVFEKVMKLMMIYYNSNDSHSVKSLYISIIVVVVVIRLYNYYRKDFYISFP